MRLHLHEGLQMPLLSHQGLISRLLEVMPATTNKSGVCHGVAMMGMQAILTGEIDVFNKRLEMLQLIPIKRFKELIETVWGWQGINTINPSLKMDPNKPLETGPEAYTEWQKSQAKNRETRLQQFKNKLEKDATKLAQPELSKLAQGLTKEDLLGIEAFLQGVNLHASPYLSGFKNLFETKLAPTTQRGGTKQVLPLLTPIKLEREKKEIHNLLEFSGLYDRAALRDYFSTLEKNYKKSEPLSLLLSDHSHGITVGYDPTKYPPWYFIDANQLPAEAVGIEMLIDRVFRGLSPNPFSPADILLFSTMVFAAESRTLDQSTQNNQWGKDWKKRPEINEQNAKYIQPESGATWLYIAARKGHLEIVNALLQNKADPNHALTDGTTPLYIAAQIGHLEIVNALLQNKADPNHASTDGTTPLYMAVQKGYLEIVNALLQNKADPNHARTADGTTPLYMAVQKGQLEVVKALLQQSADPNYALTNGTAPLHIATFSGHLEMVTALLNAGADFNKKNADGHTPLSVAIHFGFLDIIKAMLNKGVDALGALTYAVDTRSKKSAIVIADFMLKKYIENRFSYVEDLKIFGAPSSGSCEAETELLNALNQLESNLKNNSASKAKISDESFKILSQKGSDTNKIFAPLMELGIIEIDPTLKLTIKKP